MSVKGKIRYLGRFSSGELESHSNLLAVISAIEWWLIRENIFRRLAARGLQLQLICSILSEWVGCRSNKKFVISAVFHPANSNHIPIYLLSSQLSNIGWFVKISFGVWPLEGYNCSRFTRRLTNISAGFDRIPEGIWNVHCRKERTVLWASEPPCGQTVRLRPCSSANRVHHSTIQVTKWRKLCSNGFTHNQVTL